MSELHRQRILTGFAVVRRIDGENVFLPSGQLCRVVHPGAVDFHGMDAAQGTDVGDCRTYIISDTLTQLTTDHTIVQRELTEGKLTPEQARKDSRQSLLLQCVGAGKDVKPDYLSGEVLPHRTFLICCDGFRRKVTEAEIKKSCRYSSKEKKLHEALEETAQLCMKRKETDNITGILISAVGEKKGLFPLWKKATQTAGKKVIKDILLEHSTPADKIL